MQEKNESIKNWYRLLSAKILKKLKNRKFDAYYCDTSSEAVQMVLSLISESSSVSWGGSVTLEEIDLLNQVRQGNYKVIDRDTATNKEERIDLMRQALLCDTYLTSFNALTEDGVLINIDSVGNRIAAIAFGPKSVVAVIGMNKVCATVEQAIERARSHAAPLNAQRCAINPFFQPLKNTPCTLHGICGDCRLDECICSHIVQTRMSKVAGRIKIILVGESLGF